jgi:thiol:disulfide interchange protein DsbD
MKHLIAFFTLFISVNAVGQDPVNWSYSATRLDDKTCEVNITATLNQPWHIYSQDSPEGGALPTEITFNKNPLIGIDGKTKEISKLEEKYEEVFGVKVKYYTNKVVFVQKIKKKAAVKTSLNGMIGYMLCNNSQYLPPKEISFSVAIQ